MIFAASVCVDPAKSLDLFNLNIFISNKLQEAQRADTAHLSSLPHGFREDKFFYYESMGATDPLWMANFDPLGMIGRI